MNEKEYMKIVQKELAAVHQLLNECGIPVGDTYYRLQYLRKQLKEKGVIR